MSHTILQVNFSYTCSEAELQAAAVQAAVAIASFPGLTWKIWTINDEVKESGGIYCFDNEAALSAYVNSPIISALKTNPLVKNMEIKPFAAIASLTAQTRGPISALPTSLGYRTTTSNKL